MNFPVNGKKLTQASARLIEKSGGPMDYLRVAKLVYLADRESIRRRGVPIVGGHYFSMRRGPTISEFMDAVGQRNLPEWKETISPRFGNEIRLENIRPGTNALSESEMEILDAVVKEHSNRTTDELVTWCHENCQEYEQVAWNNRKSIEVESIWKASGNSPEKIRELIEEAKSIASMEKLMA